MKVGRQYQIRSDSMNVIVSRKHTRKRKDTGEKYQDWEDVAFFYSVAGALRYLVHQGVRDTELKDLRTVVAKISELETAIMKALKTSGSQAARENQE